jgi:integrase
MVLDYAKAKGHRRGENPAALKGNLEHLLPPLSMKVAHFDAVPRSEIPSFAAELLLRSSISAKALLWVTLCVCRTGDCIKMQWVDLDVDARIWTIPEGRSKAGREFPSPAQ